MLATPHRIGNNIDGNRTAKDDAVLTFRKVTKSFWSGRHQINALREISLDVRRGQVTGLIGPDGAGKTTLMRLAAGLLLPNSGQGFVLGMDIAREALSVQAGVGYMPQRFGLYDDMTVQENLDLYADLQGVAKVLRPDRYRELMRMTGLAPFARRQAGRLSGGMKQKLGLACTLVHPPQLLLLDEPTVGVDPVSRRELWQIIDRFVLEEGTTVLLSTAYLDEAERCNEVIILHEGELLGQGPPRTFSDPLAGRTYKVRVSGKKNRNVQEKLTGTSGVADAVIQGDAVRLVLEPTATAALETLLPGVDGASMQSVPPRFEDGFIALLGERLQRGSRPLVAAERGDFGMDYKKKPEGPMIAVRNIQRRFGDFYAVKGVTFDVQRGEVFGLLGANGAGKTTTFRMLCGLLPASAGSLHVAGVDVRRTAAAARARIGYMSQKFSMYGNLSVGQNLHFFSSAYGLKGRRRAERIQWATEQFDLGPVADATSATLPLGFKQRLALACALMHEPEILFLDEPTSGVDPLARREFWHRISALAAHNVTVLVTTHFMEEAEYCDRIAIMVAGEILALGTPMEIKQRARAADNLEPTMEDAFIHIIQSHEPQKTPKDPMTSRHSNIPAVSPAPNGRASMRLRGLIRKEFLQVLRDPSSLGIALVLPVVLLLLFGYGVSLDAEHVPIALVVEQPTRDTTSLCGAFEQSRYFEPAYMHGMHEALQALTAHRINAIVHLREDFSRKLWSPGRAAIQLIVNGVDANTARIISGYVEGVYGNWLEDKASESGQALNIPVRIEQRVWFNSDLRSRNFLVPGLIAVIMTLIGALLTALLMAREWERGTMEALMVTPVTIREILIGKIVPYFILGMAGMALSVIMAVWQFNVPLRGSVWVLLMGTSLFLLTALGMGLLISTLARVQFVAGQVAIITTFLPAFILSGFIFDIGSMPPVIRAITYLIPARYFVAILQTVFLAGDVWPVIVPNALALMVMATVFIGLTQRKTHKRLD